MSDGVVIVVRVTPRSGRDAVEGPDETGALRIRVAAPPAEGAANKSVVRLLARSLGVPRSAVSVIAGATGRHKRVRVADCDAAVVLALWPGVDASDR